MIPRELTPGRAERLRRRWRAGTVAGLAGCLAAILAPPGPWTALGGPALAAATLSVTQWMYLAGWLAGWQDRVDAQAPARERL